MKRIFSIIAVVAGVMLTSCEKWLDINENPNSANSTVPTPDLRLPSILAQFMDGYESAGTRVALLTGQLATTGSTGNNFNFTRWYSTAASVGWPYQAWFVNTAVNIQPMIDKAKESESYHYIGVGKILYAFGYLTLADIYGMIPYDEAFNSAIMNPKYDDASLVYERALALIDEGIVELQKQQGAAGIALAKGDFLYQGDVNKWIKLAYGIKARHLNHLSKTANFDAAKVLDALSKAPQTNAESAIYQYEDEAVSKVSNTHSLQYQNNNASRITKLYVDYILNKYTGAPTGSNDMQDPRYKLLVPGQSVLKFNATTGSRYLDTVWSQAVDMASITSAGIASTDTRYLQFRRQVAIDTTKDAIGKTSVFGTWYTEKGAKGLILTNSEMKFIEAEVLLKQGNTTGALSAYKAGIKAHIEIMGLKAEDYLSSTSVVQSASALTLSHIMIQKYIALSYSPELFSDVRRMDYCTDGSGEYNEASGVYKGFKRPGHVYTQEYSKTNMWPRRFAVASYSINYNIDQVLKQDPDATKEGYTAKPVFWDIKK